MDWLGDYPEDFATVTVEVTTNDATGAPVAPSSAFEAADIKIYKNGSATEKTTTNGITVASPFDVLTGTHVWTIDTSVDTGDVGFWTVGAVYSVLLDPDETVDGVAIRRWIGKFGIELAETLRPATAGRQLVVDAAGLADANMVKAGPTGAGTAQTAGDIIGDTNDIQSRLPAALVGGRIDASVGAMAADVLTDAATAADFEAKIADVVWDEDATGHQTQGTFGQAIGDPVADTGTIYKAVVTDATGVTVGTDTATLLTRMGTPSDLGGGATLAGNLSDIEAQTDDIGAAGAGLTALPWNAAWDAEVQSEVEDAIIVHRLDELLNADSDIDGAAPPTVGSVFHELMSATAGSFTFDQTTDSNEAIRNRGDAAWITATAVTISAGGITAASFAAGAIDAAALAADAGTEIGTAVWASATRALTDKAGFSLAADQSAVTIGTVNSVATGGITAGSIAADAIGASELATDAINEIADGVLTRAMTEAYSTDGATFTLAQGMYELMAYNQERAVSGTAMTLYRRDGTTAAVTLTLDSGVNPRTVTRTA